MLPLPLSPRCCHGPIKPFRTKAVITIKKEKPNPLISKGISLHDALPCRHVTWRRPSSFVASFPPLNYLHRQSPKKRKETACRHAEGRSSGGGSRCTCCIISGGAFTKREKKEHAPPLCTQTIPLPPPLSIYSGSSITRRAGSADPILRAAVRSSSLSSLSASDEADDSNFYCDERSPPPTKLPPTTSSPLFQARERGKRGLSSRHWLYRGGTGECAMQRAIQKGLLLLPPSLPPSLRRGALSLNCVVHSRKPCKTPCPTDGRGEREGEDGRSGCLGCLFFWLARGRGREGVSPFPKRDGLEREEEEGGGGHGGGAMPREKEKEGGAPFPFSSSPSAFVVRIGRRAPNDPHILLSPLLSPPLPPAPV